MFYLVVYKSSRNVLGPRGACSAEGKKAAKRTVFEGGDKMLAMIDNFDSYTYNLVSYFQELGEAVTVIRRDRISPDRIGRMKDLEGIIISPGPGSPSEEDPSVAVIRTFQDRVPILGVCLGHQIIGSAYGAEIRRGRAPMHGKVLPAYNNGTGLFAGLPGEFAVTRYHSLIVSGENLPPVLAVDAVDGEGIIMAMHHKYCPVYGVQFHPEAVLTAYGHELLENFLKICRNYRFAETAEWAGDKR